MRNRDKELVLRVLQNLNDRTDDTIKAIHHMKYENEYADCDVFSVSIDDLESFYNQEMLREKLGKGPDDAYSIEDCQRVADAIADFICEDFSANLENAIEYEL